MSLQVVMSSFVKEMTCMMLQTSERASSPDIVTELCDVNLWRWTRAEVGSWAESVRGRCCTIKALNCILQPESCNGSCFKLGHR